MPQLNELFDKNGLSQFFFLIEMNEGIIFFLFNPDKDTNFTGNDAK